MGECGQNKIWLDPNEVNEISLANSCRNIARLKRDGLIFKKPTVVHSRARVTLRNEAKKKGRHTGKPYRILYDLFLFCQEFIQRYERWWLFECIEILKHTPSSCRSVGLSFHLNQLG